MANTALSSQLGTVRITAESSFAEDSTTMSGNWYQLRNAMIELSSLQRPMMDRGGVFQRHAEADLQVPGAYGFVTFTTTHDLYGHGAATNGALTATQLATLLGHAIGGLNTSQVGGNVTTNSTGPTDLTSTETTIVQGGLLRVGVLGDGRAEGQALVTDDNSSSYVATTAMAGNPTTADDIFVMQTLFPLTDDADAVITSDGSSTNNTLRVWLATANQQYVCRGCAAQSISFEGLNPGELPRVTITWATTHWEPVNLTFPTSGVSNADYAPAPCSGGSFYYQTYGTATRATLQVRNVSFTHNTELIPITATGGVHEGQNIVGWRRINRPATLSFDVEALASGTTTYYDYFQTDPLSQVYKHILYTLNSVDGRAVAMYFPRCRPVGAVPSQSDVDGLNYQTLQFEAVTDTPRAGTDIVQANWKLGLG